MATCMRNTENRKGSTNSYCLLYITESKNVSFVNVVNKIMELKGGVKSQSGIILKT